MPHTVREACKLNELLLNFIEEMLISPHFANVSEVPRKESGVSEVLNSAAAALIKSDTVEKANAAATGKTVEEEEHRWAWGKRIPH